VADQAPAAWQAALPPTPGELPHQGSAQGLRNWWQQQGDPLLVELIDAAQSVSPTVAAARSRIAQARATRTGANAALLPSLDASTSASRSRSQQPGAPGPAPAITSLQAGLQTAWEIDLFGGNRASRSAATERLAGAEAQWHDARVSVAAETANQYNALRSCQRLSGITERDALSRFETARLSERSREAGFTAPATAALARASAAEAGARATQQRTQCELDLKALVALTGIDEPALRTRLAQAAASAPALAAPGALSAPGAVAAETPLMVSRVPAQALAQRPDVFSAAREVAAASADVGSADAQRYPRLSLSGSIGASSLRFDGSTSNLTTWSIGPLALSVPLFDGGQRRANLEAAQARYDEAAALYRARVRQAVREVEESLVTLQSTSERSTDAANAVAGYRASFAGTDARYKSGLASLVELEDARRLLLAAEITQANLQRERQAAWVALYRAMGGGWSPEDATSAAAPQAARSAP
jgi:NodT family efflux transporter outer membrane factor (OMF) lipoprotein